MSNDDLNKKVTARIQDQLLMILPEDEIRRRVDDVISDFFSPKKDYQGNRKLPSSFAEIVDKQLQDRIKKVTVAIFESPEWQVTVNDKMEVQIGAAIQAILNISPTALADTVANQIAKTRAQHLTLTLVNSLQQSGAISYQIANSIQAAVFQALETR